MTDKTLIEALEEVRETLGSLVDECQNRHPAESIQEARPVAVEALTLLAQQIERLKSEELVEEVERGVYIASDDSCYLGKSDKAKILAKAAIYTIVGEV